MQFACFDCRKSFKRKLAAVRKTEHPPACPQCSKEMWEMGRQFKAPSQDDIKQWRKVEALVRGGITFHSQRLYHLRNMPKVLREVAPSFEAFGGEACLKVNDCFPIRLDDAGNARLCSPGDAQQSLAADGAIACFSLSFLPSA